MPARAPARTPPWSRRCASCWDAKGPRSACGRSPAAPASTRRSPRRRRIGPDVMVAGGGDGTVSAVAAALAGGDIALGVLPLGTLNHFAKDFGMPLELEAAVARSSPASRARRRRRGQRPRLRQQLVSACTRNRRATRAAAAAAGRGKWLALRGRRCPLRRYPFLERPPLTTARTARRRSSSSATTNTPWKARHRRARPLRDGLLSLYWGQRPGRLRLLQLVLRALFGRLRQARDFRPPESRRSWSRAGTIGCASPPMAR